ncbi:alkaline phosphatase D family protein [Phenylobacterium sp. SCN 70-31]|uniref:alkaline phosphatase D family protein n=1 Tax=Phenylobacterium sp. SCN 70-31 TaxID=1660129 RepID=UPI00086D5013|nr:alkaline phosphatase D family protein [Phenylobacterium sp. SCN 70-31]ODT89185.1 MAG: alkaline phosphatase [Phenylobacterium sp. SCN 70-31]
MPSVDRRRLLIRAAALAAGAMAPAGWTTAWARTRLPENPFRLGVASGEPAPDGVVLWTRLAVDPAAPAGGMPPEPFEVGWEVAEDEALRRIVRRGRTIAAPEAGHSVHVEAAGLKPDRPYWYRFTAGGHASPVARTRTAPSPGADVRRLRIAYGSCQKYESGFYSAHAALAADDPDLVVFLGDYIYEKAATADGVRRHPEEDCLDLASYRRRYAWYKADADLQAAHACAPWMVMWDDHEVSNDYGNDQDRSDPDPALFLKRRAAAYQAYFENMPLRAAVRPMGPDMRLYRATDWGRLARLALLDDRQYRGPRPCDAQSRGKFIPKACPERTDPARSMLGADQEAWLQAGLRDTSATWNLLGQQTLMMEIVTPDGRVSNDGWDGYAQTRRRILETWRDAGTANPVVLGGDVHCFFAADLALEPGGKPVASEFVGGSIASLGRSKEIVRGMLALHPDLKFGEGDIRGYGRVDITPDACRVTFRGVENALVKDSPVRNLAAFVVEAGETGLKRA